jgi:16S rRNA (uracil1498-N3)-methyltransferase
VGEVVQLPAEQTHHALRVLRLKAGDAVELFDGAGLVAAGELVVSGGRSAGVRVRRAQRQASVGPVLHVATAWPKGPRADAMVDQLGQLGVDRLTPLLTERGVVRPGDRVVQRAGRTAVSAAKQSRRATVMRVEPAAVLGVVLDEDGGETRLVLDVAGDTAGAGLGGRLRAAGRVLVLVGPEGGWTPGELESMQAAGCERWRVGPHVMRIATAAATAAALVRYLTLPVSPPGSARATQRASQ